MSVLLCVPTYENIAPETFKSIYDLDGNEIHGRPSFEFIRGYGCAQARNRCADKAIKLGFDYLMFVDSDIILPPDAVNSLMSIDSDIAMGVYPRRNTSTGQSEIFLQGTDFLDENNLNLNFLPSSDDSQVTEIKGGGMGCTLIKTSLIKKMKYPWFKYVEYDDGSTLSEDNYFCWQAKEQADATIRCNLDVRCQHRCTYWMQ